MPFLIAALLLGAYLATGLAVAAGYWESVRIRNPLYPVTKACVVKLVLFEAARWPLTIFNR